MPIELAPRQTELRGHPFYLGGAAHDGNHDGSWESGRPSLITDHPHEVKHEGREWERCLVCGLGEAAHLRHVPWIPF